MLLLQKKCYLDATKINISKFKTAFRLRKKDLHHPILNFECDAAVILMQL